MPIRFSIQQSQDQEISGSAAAGLEDFGVSSLILNEERRLVQNLESAALAGSSSGVLAVYSTHWAGAAEPATAANQLAFLDQRLFGRLGLRITERPDAALSHEASCRRTDEYLTLLKRLWSNEKPIDHECEFYSVRKGFVANKGPQGALLPIRMTGLTGTAIQVCARHATVFDIDFGSYAEVAATVQKFREAAGRFGRSRLIAFALRVPGEALARTAGWSRTGQFETVVDLLRPYVELGITEFVFDAESLAGLGSGRANQLRSELENTVVEPPASRENLWFGRLTRSIN